MAKLSMLFVMHAAIGLALATGCSQGFEWTVHENTFLAADAGMVRELRQVAICSTETAGATWSIRLLEPCDAREVDVSIPCWPGDPAKITFELLQSLHHAEKPSRGVPGLENVARYRNREVGTFRRAWIVGTRPIALAMLSDGQEIIPSTMEKYEKMLLDAASGAPSKITMQVRELERGRYEFTGTTGVNVVDMRQREPALVSTDDADQLADIVIAFPKEMTAPNSDYLATTQPRLVVRVYKLKKPESLRDIMQRLLVPEKFATFAESTEDLPLN